MASGTQKKDLEQHIEDYFCGHGYQALTPQDYDRALGLVPAEVPTFIRASQPRGYAGPQVLHGPKIDEQLLQRRARLVAKSGGLGVDADAVPGGIGPSVRTLTNSVPVAGIASARLYLDCLRTADRQPVEWR